MADNSSRQQGLLTQRDELTKQYTTLDAQSRVEYVYTAHTDQVEGGACTVVQYTYHSPTSTLVEKMKESNGTWPVGADI
jgi:hypothetical protein